MICKLFKFHLMMQGHVSQDTGLVVSYFLVSPKTFKFAFLLVLSMHRSMYYIKLSNYSVRLIYVPFPCLLGNLEYITCIIKKSTTVYRGRNIQCGFDFIFLLVPVLINNVF